MRELRKRSGREGATDVSDGNLFSRIATSRPNICNLVEKQTVNRIHTKANMYCTPNLIMRTQETACNFVILQLFLFYWIVSCNYKDSSKTFCYYKYDGPCSFKQYNYYVRFVRYCNKSMKIFTFNGRIC